MKILLLNVHSPHNAGDLAILQETLDLLQRSFADADITVAINDLRRDLLPPGATYVDSFMRWVISSDSAGEWRWRKLTALLYVPWLLLAGVLFRLARLRFRPSSPARRGLMQAYYEADVVAVIGGGHLYARHALNIAFLWLWTGLALAVLLRKPLIMLPQSYGPLPGKLQRRMLCWLLQRSTLVAAREFRSLQLLAEIGVRRPVLLLPDLAFIAAEATPEALAAAAPQLAHLDATRPIIGFTLMNWQGQNPRFHNQHAYEEAILRLIRYVHDRYAGQIVVFAQCTGPTAAQDDRHVARRVAAAAASHAVPVLLIDEALSPASLKAAYHRLDMLVATRMHSAIFALSNAVPTIVIGYLHKSVGIMELLGLQHHVLDIDTIDHAALCAAFDALWPVRAEVQHALTERVAAIQGTLHHVPGLIQDSIAATHD
jgi:colanic acid/amylovoran biosynthesis protein